MSSSSRLTEILYDSETVLRLVDRELDELREDVPEPLHPAGSPLAVLLSLMQCTNAGTLQVLSTLQESRVALQDVTLHEIQECTAKLRDVAITTEIAASRILDGLERAHSLVDQLDRAHPLERGSGASADVLSVHTRLRDELFAIMGSLQFQDITSQQLGHVSKMLGDAERRVHATASLLEGGFTEAAAITAEPAPTFAESASTVRAFERQAAADAVFRDQTTRRQTH